MVDDSTRILELIRSRGDVRSTEIAEALGISRQAAHARLSKMVRGGRLIRAGAARATRYRLAETTWERRFPIEGLAEDVAFQQLSSEMPQVGALDGDALSTVSYVVTGLVNNAIDHSSGGHVRLAARSAADRLVVEVEDDGVGAFAHVRAELHLADELSAIQEISKGKITTAPDRHTGEGLFFVSKVANVFRLESGSLAWIVDNDRVDVAIEALLSPRVGTLARVELEMPNMRNLKQIFEEHTEDYEFSRTRAVIKLFTIGVRFISRSEAKRLLNNLDRFREVVLDFGGVDAVGQGFADEVFRVWAHAHTDITLIPVNMNDAVAFMVERAHGRNT